MARQRFVRSSFWTACGLSLGAVLLCSSSASVRSTLRVDGGRPTQKRLSAADFLKRPLVFEQNLGQMDGRVRYLARGQGFNLFLTGQEAVFVLRGSDRAASCASASPGDRAAAPAFLSREACVDPQAQARSGDVIRMVMVGARQRAEVAPDSSRVGESHYLIGPDPSRHRSHVPQYSRIRYREVYPGVDLAFYGQSQQLEFDFIVAPRVDTGRIALRFAGASRIRTDAHGDLLVETAESALRFHKPVAYQQVNGERRAVSARFAVADQRVGFALGTYDAERPLVIDPTLSFATFLGGSLTDEAMSIAVDAKGNAYIAGHTASTAFPGGSNPPGSGDAFVSKLDANGAGPAYTTYVGGTGYEIAMGIAVDAQGNAYITGVTTSSDFPVTANAPQRAVSGTDQDAFVAKLNSAGSALVYASYLGGNANDYGYSIDVDAVGSASVGGVTYSTNFPVTDNAYDKTCGTDGACDNGGTANSVSDAIFVRLNAAGTAWTYATYLGGEKSDVALGSAIDPAGNVYLAGTTVSSSFPVTSGVVQGSCGSDGQCNSGGANPLADAFVVKFDPAGALAYSTYLGGSKQDYGFAVAADASGNAYLTGYTLSADFPTTEGAYDRKCGVDGYCTSSGYPDAFVAKLNPTATALSFSTFLGGSDEDSGTGVAVDSIRHVWVSGRTFSSDFSMADAFQPTPGGRWDGFVSEFSSDGKVLVASSYFGGSENENTSWGALALDGANNVYLAGDTNSSNFPTQNAIQTQFGGGTCTVSNSSMPCSDAYVAKLISSSTNAPDFTLSASPASQFVSRGTKASFTITATPFNGRFGKEVTLDCEEPPKGFTCSFDPAKITPDADAVTSTLSLTIPRSASNAIRPGMDMAQAPRLARLWSLSTLVLVGVSWIGAGRRRGRRWRMLLGWVVATQIAALSACNSAQTVEELAGTYSISVKGTAGATVHTMTVVVGVQ
ncbi:MAG: SBBP repeat-containing protein [Vicinamibacteria bacterium]|nr:SBBP repeat-containing protein [Vicinamibacteria bacterium]